MKNWAGIFQKNKSKWLTDIHSVEYYIGIQKYETLSFETKLETITLNEIM